MKSLNKIRVLFGYEDAKAQKIVSLGKGSGGINELATHLKDDIIAYGLVRYYSHPLHLDPPRSSLCMWRRQIIFTRLINVLDHKIVLLFFFLVTLIETHHDIISIDV
jgi:hypothetical protein